MYQCVDCLPLVAYNWPWKPIIWIVSRQKLSWLMTLANFRTYGSTMVIPFQKLRLLLMEYGGPCNSCYRQVKEKQCVFNWIRFGLVWIVYTLEQMNLGMPRRSSTPRTVLPPFFPVPPTVACAINTNLNSCGRHALTVLANRNAAIIRVNTDVNVSDILPFISMVKILVPILPPSSCG